MNFWKKITAFFRQEKFDAEMAEEMRTHLERRTQANLRAGLPSEEARYEARRQFGGVEQLKELAREQRGWPWGEDLWRDFRFALRSLLKTPGFTVVSLLTLALGIGACVAIFSVVNSVLLRPLAYADSDRLVVIREVRLPQLSEMAVAPANYSEWRERAASFEQLAAIRPASYTLTGAGEPLRVEAERVTSNYFSTLRARPWLGREFSADEAATRKNVAVLSYGFWQRQFGGRRDILTETIQLDGRSFQVVGVMPENFSPGSRTEIFTPVPFDEGRKDYGHSIRVIGRMKPGVTIEQASGELALIAERLALQSPDTNRNWSTKLTPMFEATIGSARPMLFSLLGAVGFLLLIACANVAHLLLARTAGRAKEIAVRIALGAARRRVVRQLLTESVVLALTGGVLGVLLAQWGVSALLAFAPDTLPRAQEIGLDFRAVGFACALGLVTGVGFGLAPAFQASRVDLNASLKDAGRGTSAGHHRQRLRGMLIVGEVAIALILLAGAGLLIRSFARLQDVDTGFQPRDAWAVEVSLPATKYRSVTQQNAFANQAVTALAAVPGVQSVGAANVVPFGSRDFGNLFFIAGQPEVPKAQLPSTNYYAVTPAYFEAMGIALRRGRGFDARDAPGSPRVVIINEAMAKKMFSGQDPLGQRLNITNQPETVWREIVGVVGDVKQYSLGADAPLQVYEPFAQQPFPYFTFIVRTAGAVPGLPAAIRAAIYSVDKSQPVASVGPLSTLIASSVARQRFTMFLFSVFSGVALLLAAVGIYGIVAYSVSQRTNEFGIRLSLGAQRFDVLRLVFVQNGQLIALGLGAGWIGAFALSRLIESMLFGIDAHDPLTFAAVGALLAAVAGLACLIPARRATKIEPMVALRTE
jgi:predicted permease